MRGARAKFIRNLTMMSNKVNPDMLGETVKRVVKKRNPFGLIMDKVTVSHHPESLRGLYRKLKRLRRQDRYHSNISPRVDTSSWDRWERKLLTRAA